jgi:hypothetical protein
MGSATAWINQNKSIRTVSGSLFPIVKDTKRFFIDIDGTICFTCGSDYHNSKPDHEKIRAFNKLLEEGSEVHYWTARGANSGKSWDKFTIDQLQSWNVRYTSINMGKPHYDVWIDDKSIHPDHF